MGSSLLPDLPEINLTFPTTPLIEAAFAFIKEHVSETVWGHTVRSAYFAVITAKKMPAFANVDLDAVVLSCILHDLGWSEQEGFVSTELRFEVDGAEIARKWLREQVQASSGDGDNASWDDKHRQQLLWDAIALHTSPDIAAYKEPEVALTFMSIFTDFAADRSPAAVTRDEWKAVVRAFPRREFAPDGFKGIICGLCARKPKTTFDNFVGQFGLRFGYDGKGTGREEYAAKAEEASLVNMLLTSLDYTEGIVSEMKAEGK
jgi:hypothetical protein